MSTEYARQNKAFKEVNEFIRQLRTFGNVEMRPDPNSKRHMRAADDVDYSITEYEEATRDFLRTMEDIRKKADQAAEMNPPNKLDSDYLEDFGVTTAQLAQFAVGVAHLEDIKPVLKRRYEAALALIEAMTRGITLGIIRPSEGLPQKLEECKKQNRILAKQILQYKEQLNLK